MLARLYGNGEADLITKKSVDCENEVNVRWQMPNWHVHTMINVRTKFGEPRL